MYKIYLRFFLLFCLIFNFSISFASNGKYEIIIKDHMFNPSILCVPAGQKLIITVDNQDSTIEEFESIELKREKIIPGKSKAKVIIAPLKKGEYEFFGEFHEETAQGKIIVYNEEDLENGEMPEECMKNMSNDVK